MSTVQVWLGETPPSLNAVGARGNPVTFHRHKKRLQGDIETLLMAERFPKGQSAVHVEAILRFTTNRRRDTGNYQAILEKACGDALVRGGWLADDTADLFGMTLRFDPEPGLARTTLVFRGREVEDAAP